jgi:hypothetical protein
MIEMTTEIRLVTRIKIVIIHLQAHTPNEVRGKFIFWLYLFSLSAHNDFLHGSDLYVYLFSATVNAASGAELN